jgi:hypothetical protein
MDIGILGTGSVARTVAAALAGLSHQVTLGTRDVAATLARTEADAAGTPPLAGWRAQHPDIGVLTFADAAAHAELVVNATAGSSSLAALRTAGAATLAGKVLLDIANPLDFSAGMPPTLFVKDTDSLAEQIQREFPQTRVVKALNTMSAAVMVDPKSLGAPSAVFVSGDDAAAREAVTGLLHALGWADVIDLGNLATARGTEMILPLWLRLWQSLGTAQFNFAVVRRTP